MRWRLLLEEYGPELKYIKGEHNVVADALGQLPLEWCNKDLEGVEEPTLQLSCVTSKDIEDEK